MFVRVIQSTEKRIIGSEKPSLLIVLRHVVFFLSFITKILVDELIA